MHCKKILGPSRKIEYRYSYKCYGYPRDDNGVEVSQVDTKEAHEAFEAYETSVHNFDLHWMFETTYVGTLAAQDLQTCRTSI